MDGGAIQRGLARAERVRFARAQDEIDAGFERGARLAAAVERRVEEIFASDDALDAVVSDWVDDPVAQLSELYRFFGKFRRVARAHRAHLLPFLADGIARILENDILRVAEKQIEHEMGIAR